MECPLISSIYHRNQLSNFCLWYRKEEPQNGRTEN